jgi:hypothetical protein
MAEKVAPRGWLVATEDLGHGREARRYAYADGATREVVVDKFPNTPVSDAYLAHLAYSPPPGPRKA